MLEVAPRYTPTFLTDLLSINPCGWGVSTGYMDELRDDWDRMLPAAADVSTYAIELSALSGPELAPLARALRDPSIIAPFGHVSVHAPSKGWCGTAEELVVALDALPTRIAGFVVHPEALPQLGPFAALGDRLWIENMDRRKRDARTVDELARFFAVLPDARFCFDIAHARQHDPSMHLAHGLLDAYGERLAEVHVSSVGADGVHIPVTRQDADAFGAVLERCAGVPWILEAPLPVRV